MIDELSSEESQTKIRSAVDSILAQLGDTLDVYSRQVMENLIGDITAGRVNALMDSLTLKAYVLIRDSKRELLDESLENYLEHLLNEVLRSELQGVIDGVWYELSAPERVNPRIIELRRILEAHIDSLAQSASVSIGSRSDSLLRPVLDEAGARAEVLLDDTQKRTKGVIRYAIIGLIVLVVIGGLVYQLIWKNRYKSMLKVITKNIDEINSQKIYDDLTESIKKDMSNRNLEKHLRKEILEKEGLTEQPECEDKDRQVLRLMMEVIGSDTETRSLSSKSPKEVLRQKAEEIGLRDHLDSLLKRFG